MIGSIDVFWKNDLGLHLRDWKITPEEEAPHEMYDAQLEFYALACKVAFPASDVDAGLIYLRNAESEIDVRRIIDWEKIRRSVQNAAIEASGSSTRLGDCDRCPFPCPTRTVH
jgi:hypothetical protein